jgi:hypothetical protein
MENKIAPFVIPILAVSYIFILLNMAVSRLNARSEIEKHSERFFASSHWSMFGLLLHNLS